MAKSCGERAWKGQGLMGWDEELGDSKGWGLGCGQAMRKKCGAEGVRLGNRV